MSNLPGRYFTWLRASSRELEAEAIKKLIKIQDARTEATLRSYYEHPFLSYQLPSKLGYERQQAEVMAKLFIGFTKKGRENVGIEIGLLRDKLQMAAYNPKKDAFGLATFDAVEYYKRHALKISGNFDEAQRKAITGTLTKITQEGLTKKEAMSRLASSFQNFSKYRLENIARTESANMLNFGRLVGLYENKAMGLVDVVEFSAVLDSRVTDCCETRHGMTIRLDDYAGISDNTPPLHYMCRSILLPTYITEPKMSYDFLKESHALDKYPPMEGFGLKNLDGILPGTQNKARFTFLDSAPKIPKAPPAPKEPKLPKEPKAPKVPKAIEEAIAEEGEERAGHSFLRIKLSREKVEERVQALFPEFHKEQAKSHVRAIESYLSGGSETVKTKSVQAVMGDYNAANIKKMTADAYNHYKEKANAVENYIARATKFKQEKIFRGINLDPNDYARYKGITKGEHIQMGGISTWTTNNKHLDIIKEANCVFRTQNNSGVSVVQFSNNPGRQEVLHSVNSRWQVVKITETTTPSGKKQLVFDLVETASAKNQTLQLKTYATAANGDGSPMTPSWLKAKTSATKAAKSPAPEPPASPKPIGAEAKFNAKQQAMTDAATSKSPAPGSSVAPSANPTAKEAILSREKIYAKPMQREHLKPMDVRGVADPTQKKIDYLRKTYGYGKQEAEDLIKAAEAFTGSEFPGIRAMQTGPGSIYDHLLPFLRKESRGGVPFTEILTKWGKDLEKLIEKLPRFNDTVPIYRRIQLSNEAIRGANWKVGAITDMKGASSWTSNKDVFANRNIHFVTKNRSGVSVKHLSKYGDEDEVLHSAKSRWRILKIEDPVYAKSGNIVRQVIHVEEVLL